MVHAVSTLVAFAQAAQTHGAHHHAHVPKWLIHLGGPGLFVVSVLDASPIPLPLPGSGDLLLLLLCAQPHAHALLLALATIAASVAGGYLTWATGHKGGEAMLQHFVPARLLQRMTRWMRGNGAITVAISAILPPPVPLMPLLLGAGAFGATRTQFLIAFTLARGARYGFVAWMGATYGRHVLHWWNQYLSRWSGVVLWTFIGLLVTAIAVGIWQYRRQQRSWKQRSSAEARATL